MGEQYGPGSSSFRLYSIGEAACGQPCRRIYSIWGVGLTILGRPRVILPQRPTPQDTIPLNIDEECKIGHSDSPSSDRQRFEMQWGYQPRSKNLMVSTLPLTQVGTCVQIRRRLDLLYSQRKVPISNLSDTSDLRADRFGDIVVHEVQKFIFTSSHCSHIVHPQYRPWRATSISR